MERNVREGMKVRSRDGADLGRVMLLEGEQILIEKGFFFPKDYWIHVRDIAELRDDEVLLTLSADELREGSGAAPEVAAGGIAGTQPAGLEATGLGESTGRDRMHGAREEVRMPLAEEELSVEKRERESGEVRVRKEVVTETRQVEVPVTREEVHVERVPASASSDAGRDSFQEKTVSVPVREEEVEIRKRPRVKEEVRISKTPVQTERRVEAEVRREEARVEGTEDAGRLEEGGATTRRGPGLDDPGIGEPER